MTAEEVSAEVASKEAQPQLLCVRDASCIPEPNPVLSMIGQVKEYTSRFGSTPPKISARSGEWCMHVRLPGLLTASPRWEEWSVSGGERQLSFALQGPDRGYSPEHANASYGCL